LYSFYWAFMRLEDTKRTFRTFLQVSTRPLSERVQGSFSFTGFTPPSPGSLAVGFHSLWRTWPSSLSAAVCLHGLCQAFTFITNLSPNLASSAWIAPQEELNSSLLVGQVLRLDRLWAHLWSKRQAHLPRVYNDQQATGCSNSMFYRKKYSDFRFHLVFNV
jgi:hypothetical protein